MNRSLLDPFALAQEHPDKLTAALSHGHANCISFSPQGDYIAAGLSDGPVTIIDLDTNGVRTILRLHTQPVQSVSWSLDGRYLLTCARDWKLVYWDLKDSSVKYSIRFDASIWMAALHPVRPTLCVAALYEDEPKMADLASGQVWPLPTEDEPGNGKHLTLCLGFLDHNHIVSGTSKGHVNVIDVDTRKIVFSSHICTSSITSISIGKRHCLALCGDRVIRVLTIDSETQTIEVFHKLQDVVNRLQWNSCHQTPSGEFVVASTDQNAHSIYMWETSVGTLVKIYEGPKEELGEVLFHPSKPILVATGLDSGCIYMWTSFIPQKWSALAPDFVELEENIEYEEREDEFDIVETVVETEHEVEGDVDVFGDAVINSGFVLPVKLS